MAIGTVSVSLLLLLGPVLAVLLAKSRRRKSRRRAQAAESVRGSWDELVDTAIDSGLVVEPHLTRQEVAWALASQWTPKKSESDEEGDAKARKARKRSAADVRVPGWSLFSGAVPGPSPWRAARTSRTSLPVVRAPRTRSRRGMTWMSCVASGRPRCRRSRERVTRCR